LPLAEVAIRILVGLLLRINLTSTVQGLSLADFSNQILVQGILRTNLCVSKLGNLSHLPIGCLTRSLDKASYVFAQALEFKRAVYLHGDRSY
jgi:hypothetical protein